MSRRTRFLALLASLPAIAGLGCSLTKPDADAASAGSTVTTPTGAIARLGRGAAELGLLVTPRRNALKVMIASRPVEEPALGDDLWRAADEQVVPAELRRKLEANGLRLGVVDGALPASVEDLLDPDKPPTERIDPVVLALPDGDATPIGAGPAAPLERLSLFFSQDGGAVGKDFDNARGAFRVSANQKSGDDPSIALRIVPEVHHGPFQRHYAADANPAAFEPQQIIYKDGQQEESFRDLAATIDLGPDQVLVLGCWPGRSGSLGHFLLTEIEPGTDRLLRKVILIWATTTTTTSIPWVEPVTPPEHLQPIDPDELAEKR